LKQQPSHHCCIPNKQSKNIVILAFSVMPQNVSIQKLVSLYMTIKADKYNWNRVKFCRKITIFKMSTCNFLRVAEFSTRNIGIPTRILLLLYSKFRALSAGRPSKTA
jgi:hypothetical protein